MADWKVWKFLRAAGRIGGSSVIFAVLLFAIGTWEHYKQRNVPASWLVVVGLFFFTYGCYLAWSKEHDKATELSARLVDETPQLRLGILEGLNVYDASRDIHVFVLSVVLGNAGAPTSVLSWRGSYEIGNSREEMIGFNIIDSYTIRLAENTKAFYQRELIQTIIAGHRIERKASITGRILLTVPGNRRTQVDSCSYQIKLTAFDFDGNEVSCVFSPAATASSRSHNYFPHEEPPTRNDIEGNTNETRVLRGPGSTGELREEHVEALPSVETAEKRNPQLTDFSPRL
jgi:hypothetical protein